MIRVDLGPRGYDIAVNAAGGLCAFLAARTRSRKAYLFSDFNVAACADRLFAELTDRGFTCRQTTIPSGESSKSLCQAEILYARLAEMPADRQTLVIAVGGGVTGDLAGFVAATYNRGLPLVMVPTTLLAMVDSAVGGKVSINLSQGKNLVGAFHQPVCVWIDTGALATLPDREFRSGLAEVVKYGASLDAQFFAWLEANATTILAREPSAIAYLIARSCELKARIVEKDEREETGERMKLNYGHTFAHAFETVAGYGQWLHGEAVAAGMICASRLAEQLGMIADDVTERQIALLNRFGLPVAPPSPPRTDEWLQAMRRDKKASAGQLRFVLLRIIGEATTVGAVPEEMVRAIIG